MVVASTKLTSKHQITIPSEIRRRLHLEAGDVLYLAIEDDHVVLRAARGGWTESTRGLGADLWSSQGGGAAVIEAERDSWE